MKQRLVIRPTADHDLLTAADHISDDRINAADRFINAVVRAMNDVADEPGIGSPYETDHPRLQGLRKWPVHGFTNYQIYYLHRHGRIEVVRVLHGAQNVRRILEQE